MRRTIIKFNQHIAIDTFVTQTFKERNRGLFAFESLNDGQGLLLLPCRSVHSFFMRYAIDLIYLDKSLVIVKLVENMRPNRMSCRYNAYSTLELNAGEIGQLGLRVGMTGHDAAEY